MKGAIWKLLLIAFVIAICIFSVSPPEEKIRLGKDLRGGVSFVYAINVPEDANREEVIAQTIDVLKRRVNPQGVLDIAFQPQGANRMEVVMPLPSPEVRARQLVFQADLQNLILESAITRGALTTSLEGGDAVDRFGGDDSNRRAQIETLQGLTDEATQARAELATKRDQPEATSEEIGELENRIARAELRSDELIDDLVAGRLSEARVQAALALPGKERRKRGPDDVFFTIPSERDEQIAELRAEFPHLSGKLDTMLGSYADYAEIRTGLDDPEDLKRLLSGAGVLEFRIAVSAADPQGVNPVEMREQLADRGPRNTDSPVASWYPLNDLEQWVDSPEQLRHFRPILRATSRVAVWWPRSVMARSTSCSTPRQRSR
jgi:preprotein translocase subunit SecD